jgi:hypothetical protein
LADGHVLKAASALGGQGKNGFAALISIRK